MCVNVCVYASACVSPLPVSLASGSKVSMTDCVTLFSCVVVMQTVVRRREIISPTEEESLDSNFSTLFSLYKFENMNHIFNYVFSVVLNNDKIHDFKVQVLKYQGVSFAMTHIFIQWYQHY